MKKTAEEHLKSTLARIESLLGRRMTSEELVTALCTLMSWRDMLAVGLTTEQVVAIAKAEVAAHAMH